jgi:ubiquinone/menaquinone biosynthesis C-methylase UbiE
MRKELERWLTHDGVRLFRDLGLRLNDRVLDFGCGDGVYSIPAAKVVGEKGVVFALDRNQETLMSLMEKASRCKVSNVVPVHDLNELKRMLCGMYLDAVFLYDVIHSYYFTERERVRLLREISRMVKTNGLISIFPRHMESDEIRTVTDTLSRLHYSLVKQQSHNLMHDGGYTFDFTLNFRKVAGWSDAENKTL